MIVNTLAYRNQIHAFESPFSHYLENQEMKKKRVSNENLYDVTDHRAKYAVKFIKKKKIYIYSVEYIISQPKKKDKPYDTSFIIQRKKEVTGHASST